MADYTADLFSKISTCWRLGLRNVLRVVAYRALLKTGVYARILPIRAPLTGPFFTWEPTPTMASAPLGVDTSAWSASAERILRGELCVFSHRWVECGFPPRWHRSIVSNVELEDPQRHWSHFPEFALAGGDIKGYWELARFQGLLVLTLGWIGTRREDFRLAIENWLASWCNHNPANAGIHWRCGQETGLRLMNVLLVATLLFRWGGVRPTPCTRQLVAEHCQRIAATLLYAVGQDNNHGTSEAAALFVGGVFLARSAEVSDIRRGKYLSRIGRRWLENRVQRLVMPDGSFSQHSTNYHRLLLDTCSLVETMRRFSDEEPFSAKYRERCAAATKWLASMIDPTSGDAPNLGANDGAHMFALHRLPYRDFRPSVQWASALFLNHPTFASGPYDEPLRWLGLDVPSLSAVENILVPHLWPDGGYAKLVASDAWLLLRLPRYRFRPSQADGLHLDLWVRGVNLLPDAGTYTYNADPTWLRYFSGTIAHNTVQFDDHDQMPRLSRFLFGDWLECTEVDFDASGSAVAAGYRDRWGANHRRSVRLRDDGCTVVDSVTGFHRRAILRWRLPSSVEEWFYEDGAWCNGRSKIRVHSTAPITRFEKVEGWGSQYYTEKHSLQVLEVEVRTSAVLTTELTWLS